jgi:putative transposase
MSALIETSAASPAAQPAPRGVQWIDLKEAAKRSGRTEGHLSRQCRAEWGAAGLAELRTPSGGGKAAWHVREDADASFARVRFPEQISAEAIAAKAKLTRAQRDQITQRKQILDQWADRLKAGQVLGLSRNKVTASFLDNLLVQEDLRLSRATLYNWHTAYRSRGELGLLDGRSAAAAESAVEQRDDPFLEFVQRLFLNPRKLRLSDCLRAAEGMAAEQGWEVRSYKACQRHVNSLPRQLVVKLREGESAFVAKCEPYIERDYTSIDSNDIWCADDHRFDVMIKHEGRFIRPILTGFEDLRSRMIVGWRIIPHDATAQTVLAAFESAALEHGLPRSVYVDNGKHYDGRDVQGVTKQQRRRGEQPGGRFSGAFNILSIPLTHAWPYHGQSKPIERAFRTVCDRFSRLWDTYCGNSPGERPEDLQRHLDTGKAPTLAEFTAAFSEWLADSYHGVKHLGDGMDGQTPSSAHAAHLVRKRPIDPAMLTFACMPAVGPIKVARHGVAFKGLRFGAFDADVQKLFGKEVMVKVNPRDLSHVLVCGLGGELICRARANTKLAHNARDEDLREAIGQKKQLRRTLAQYTEHRPRMSQDLHQLVNASARKRRAAEQAEQQPEPPAPPSLMPVRTQLDDQLSLIRRHVTRQSGNIAVGAESLELDRLRPAGPSLERSDGDDGDEIDVFASLGDAMRRQQSSSQEES